MAVFAAAVVEVGEEEPLVQAGRCSLVVGAEVVCSRTLACRFVHCN